MTRVALIVPCYNEATRLPQERFAAFDLKHRDLEVLFVNDGSKDATADVLAKLCDRREGFSFISLAQNSGKAEAVRQGMQHAMSGALGDIHFVGFWDADLATPLEELPDFCDALEQGAVDMVFGSRVMLLGRTINRRLYRHLYGRVFATAVSNLLRLPIYDTQCGAKLFRVTPELSEVLSTPFMSRWIFDVEMIARFIGLYEARGVDIATRIIELPLRTWQDVAGSKVTTKDAAKAALELARMGARYRDSLRQRKR